MQRSFKLADISVARDITKKFNSGEVIEINEPEGTLVINGELILDESTRSTINIKNLIVTPFGKLTVHNCALTAKATIVNFGKISIFNSSLNADYLHNCSKETNIRWLALRQQIIWARKPNTKELIEQAEVNLQRALRQQRPSRGE